MKPISLFYKIPTQVLPQEYIWTVVSEEIPILRVHMDSRLRRNTDTKSTYGQSSQKKYRY